MKYSRTIHNFKIKKIATYLLITIAFLCQLCLMSCAQHKNAPVLKKYRKTFDASVLNRYYSGQFTLAWNKKSDCELIETKDFKVNPLVFNGKQYPIKLLNLGHGQFREKADYYTIQAIGKNAFKDNKDIGIVFVVPTMIKTIDERAFANTSIKNICINNVTTFLPINQNAFAGCKINKIIAKNVLYKANQDWNKICQNIVIKPYSLSDYDDFIAERTLKISANYTITDKSGKTIDTSCNGTCWVVDKVNRNDDNDYSYWIATNLHVLSAISKYNNDKYGNDDQKKIKNLNVDYINIVRFDKKKYFFIDDYEKYKNKKKELEKKLISCYLVQLSSEKYKDWDNFVTQFDNPTWKENSENKPIITNLTTLLNCSIDELNANKINDLDDEIKNDMQKMLHNKQVIDNTLKVQFDEWEKITKKLNEIREQLILRYLYLLWEEGYTSWDAFADKFDEDEWRQKMKIIIERLAIVLDCDFANVDKRKIKELVKEWSKVKELQNHANAIKTSDAVKIDYSSVEKMKQNFMGDFCIVKMLLQLDRFPTYVQETIKNKLSALNRYLSINNSFVVFAEKISKDETKVYSAGYPYGEYALQMGEIYGNQKNYFDGVFYKWVYGIRTDDHLSFGSGSSGSMIIDENFNIIGINHSTISDHKYIVHNDWGYGKTNLADCLLVDDEYNPIAKFLHD